MADEKNILQLNDGVPITDPTNGFMYIVIDGIDHFIGVDNLLKGLLEPYSSIINVPGASNYNISNPFTLPKIPQITKLISPDGTISLNVSVNQSTGEMTVYSIIPINNMILTVIGW